MTLRVTLFDRFTVTDENANLPIRLRPRSQRLLAYLIMQRGRPVARRQLAFTLWQDTTEDDALATARRALNDLRTAIDLDGVQTPILVSSIDLRWNAQAPATVDLIEFERLADQETLASLHAAADLYRGDLLAAWDDDWAIVERERMRERFGAVLRRLVEHHRAIGETGTALSLARRSVALDPLAEAAQRVLIALLYESGDRAAALASYERLRLLLREELDVAPMAETEALRDAIASGLSLPVERSPLLVGSSTGVPRTATPIVGRDDELAQLSDLWTMASSGNGQLTIITGEAGVGKSRLAAALAEQVTHAGGLALVGHCYALEQALPYQPIVEALRSAALALRHADLAPIFRGELVRLASDLSGVLGNAVPGATSGAIDPRSQLFEALLQAFLALARGRPVLLVVEDVHWAAQSTIDWLAYVAPRLAESRLLVVATYRTEEVGAAHALSRLRRRLVREGALTVLALNRLSRSATHTLMALESGLPPDIAGRLAERLYRETSGNPFFLHEIVRGLIEGGQIVLGTGRWEGPFVDAAQSVQLPLPESLRETIRTRIGRLTEMARVFSVAAAVTGQVFPYDIVREAGGWTDEAALDGLEDLLQRGFVNETNDGEYVFSHHLVRETLYAELTAPRRVYWHGRLADAYERSARRLPPVERQGLAARIVHHAVAGDRGDLVFRWAPVAAERARGLAAYADALSLLEAASKACERLCHDPETDSEACERQHIDVLLNRSDLMPHVGRSVDEHGWVLERVAELLLRFPDDRQQAAFDLRYADYLSDNGQYELAGEAAMRASDRCLALNDRRGAAQGRYQASVSWMTIGKTRAAMQVCEEALELFQATGHLTGEVLSLSAIAMAGANLGRIELGMQYLQRALELSERRDDRLGMARACYGLAFAWSYYYRSDRILEFAERSIALYEQIGFAWTAWRPRLFVAIAESLSGDQERSDTTLAEVDARAHAMRDTWLEGWTAQLLGRFAFYRGDPDACESHLERARVLRQETRETPHQASDLAWYGRLRLTQGRVDDALDLTGQAVVLLDSLRDEYWVWETPDVYFIRSHALASAGNSIESHRHLRLAYDTLMEFGAQIAEPENRERYFAYPPYATILSAWDAVRTNLR